MPNRDFKAILSEESADSVKRAIDDVNELDGEIVEIRIVENSSGRFTVSELVITVKI